MLLNDFYHITKSEKEGPVIQASLHINGSHKIFEGHFPGLPVVPGVCMLQMITEIVEGSLGRKFTLKSADNIKFMNIINPEQQCDVDARISLASETESVVDINAQLFSGDTTFFKLKAKLQRQ